MVCGVVRDVAEHKREEEQLRVQGDRLREQASLLDVTNDAILVRNFSGEIRFWNRAAEALYGWSQDEAIGKIAQTLLQTEYPPDCIEVEEVVRRDGRWRGYLHQTKRDGSRIAVACRKVLQQDDGGNPSGIFEIHNDVTGRERAELESEPDATVVMDGDGKIVIVNKQMENIFGYSREELIGSPIEMLLPERFRHREPGRPGSFILDPRLRPTESGLELYGLRRDSSEFPIEVSPRPRETHHGGLISSAIRDITMRKRAENEIVKLNRDLLAGNADLADANEELEAFTYSVAHDLRSPLRHIQGFAKMLAESLGDGASPRAREYMAEIIDSTQGMGRMVDDLLALARVGRQGLNIQVTSLNSLVAEAVKDLRGEVEDREIEWRIGDLPYLDCDPGLLRQVFCNLVSNAVKYSRPRHPAVIEVGQIVGEGPPTIFVRDNGVGFNIKYADKLFGAFQRLHRKEDFEGTGVGLATVQRIIHKHGGLIWAKAEVDKGATFFFTLGVPSTPEKKAKNEHE